MTDINNLMAIAHTAAFCPIDPNGSLGVIPSHLDAMTSAITAAAKHDWVKDYAIPLCSAGVGSVIGGPATYFSSSKLFKKQLQINYETRQEERLIYETRKNQQETKHKLLAIDAAIVGFTNNINKLIILKRDIIIPLKADIEQAIKIKESGDTQRMLKEALTQPLIMRLSPRLVADTLHYAEKLGFVGTNAPLILHTLHSAREYIHSLAYDIEERNSFIKKFMEKTLLMPMSDAKELHEQEIQLAITAIRVSADLCLMLIVDMESALWFARASVQLLNDYKIKFLQAEPSETQWNRDMQQLMPPDIPMEEFSQWLKRTASFQ